MFALLFIVIPILAYLSLGVGIGRRCARSYLNLPEAQRANDDEVAALVLFFSTLFLWPVEAPIASCVQYARRNPGGLIRWIKNQPPEVVEAEGATRRKRHDARDFIEWMNEDSRRSFID